MFLFLCVLQPKCSHLLKFKLDHFYDLVEVIFLNTNIYIYYVYIYIYMDTYVHIHIYICKHVFLNEFFVLG